MVHAAIAATLVLSFHGPALRPPQHSTRLSPAVRPVLVLEMQPATVADSSGVTADLEEMEAQALEMDIGQHSAILEDPSAFKPTRGPDGRLQPVLTLPNDSLETTPLMGALTAVSTVAMLSVVARAFASSSGLPVAPLLAVLLGCVAGELFSGTFHWATDNYGSLKTPVVGFACAAFQGHHLAPWTIAHRSFVNNVYKIAAATLPLFTLALLLLSPSGAAFVAVLFYTQLLAQEFHRWSHTRPKDLPRWKRALQDAGIALPFKEHIAHHKPPFDKHYCILTGGLNGVLDSEPVLFWRRLEGLVYRWNGQEPLSWKKGKVKELSLSLWPNVRGAPV